MYLLLLGPRGARGRSCLPAQFLAWSAQPGSSWSLNVVTLFFVVFHAITWFNLAPQAMVVRVGGTRVPGSLIAGSNYLAWVDGVGVGGWLLLG